MAGAAADDEVAAVRHAEGEDGFGVGVVGGSTMDDGLFLGWGVRGVV